MLAIVAKSSIMIPWFDVPSLPLGVDVPTLLSVIAAGVLLFVVRQRARHAGLSVRRALDGAFVMLGLALLLGHALDMVLYRRDELAANPWLLAPWHGGSCSLGALVAMVLAVGLCFRESGRVDWRYVDQLAVAVLAGLLLFRAGCFLGHHHAGRLSSFALAVAYPGGARHDLGLDEMLLAFVVLTAVRWLTRRSLRPGTLAALVGAAYGAGRFAIEFLRGADLELLGRRSDPRTAGLTLVQFASLGLIIGAVFFLGARRYRRI